MEKTYEFLKKCGTYYIATMDGDKPRVRPFGTVNIFEGKLYIQTGKVKNVSKQMHANPKIEISAFTEGKWIRLEATAVVDDRIEAHQSMFEEYPSLLNMYKPGDGNTETWYLKDATSKIISIGGEVIVENF
ncbi:pyridoxamine 5'-phosphate oxidase family protein [Anaerocolumna chitinilytica]|uniref:Pyridoxamine 5'-phosphate oxidase n=1 Tax=Anaerocolumna chitinilytica TaxID=1727145 RepID=A0A7I8DK32_9FIRM|nr:pyridoxamine 5'-phosphate oxidase family protein [Anaerocolumna chitinilytica]BCJ98769.1 pyridoxamine 5'-phosphate oxidase [Anaerocolumna chitinilytica]